MDFDHIRRAVAAGSALFAGRHVGGEGVRQVLDATDAVPASTLAALARLRREAREGR